MWSCKWGIDNSVFKSQGEQGLLSAFLNKYMSTINLWPAMPWISQPGASLLRRVLTILPNRAVPKSAEHSLEGLDRNHLNHSPFILPDFQSVTSQTVLRLFKLNLSHKTWVFHITKEKHEISAAAQLAQRRFPALCPGLLIKGVIWIWAPTCCKRRP